MIMFFIMFWMLDFYIVILQLFLRRESKYSFHRCRLYNSSSMKTKVTNIRQNWLPAGLFAGRTEGEVKMAGRKERWWKEGRKAGGDLLSYYAFLFYEPRLCQLCFDAASLRTKAVSRTSQIETLHQRERVLISINYLLQPEINQYLLWDNLLYM